VSVLLYTAIIGEIASECQVEGKRENGEKIMAADRADLYRDADDVADGKYRCCHAGKIQ
jgi:hypothetical protein